MDDRRLTEMLGRATEDPSAALRDRIHRAVEVELDRPERRTRKWGLAVAGLAAVVAAVVAWSALDGDWRLDIGPADQREGSHVLPQQWPEGLDGPTQLDELSSVAPPFRPGPATFLVGEEQAAFATIIATDPAETDLSGTGGVEVLPDGREVQTAAAADGTWAFVEVGDGRSALLRSEVEGAELARLAAAFTDGSGVPETQLLPESWGWVENPPAAASLAVGATPERLDGWWMATRSAPSASGLGRRVQVLIGPAEDPEEVVSQVSDLTAGFSEQVDVGGRPGVLVTLSALRGAQSLVTSPGDGTIAVVTGTEVTTSELRDVAASLEPVSDERWEALTTSAFAVGNVPGGYQEVAAPPGEGEQYWGWDCCGTHEPATVLSPDGRADHPGVVVVSAVGFYPEAERGGQGGLHQAAAGYGTGRVAFEHDGAEAYFTPHRSDGDRAVWSDLLVATGEGAAVRVTGPERSLDELLAVVASVEPVTAQTAVAPVVVDPPLGLQSVGSVSADVVMVLGSGASTAHYPPTSRTLAWRSTAPGEGDVLVSTLPAGLGDLEAILALPLRDVTMSRADVDGRPAVLVESRDLDSWPVREVWTEAPWGDLLVVKSEGDRLLTAPELAEIAASVRQES